MAYAAKHPAERFWPKVDVAGPDDCWEWQGARFPSGYGFIHAGALYTSNKRFVKAHRLSWEIHNGPLPPGANVLHHCDNPPCVNPAHLYMGTRADNARDRGQRMRGREHRQRGESNRNARLTEADVRAIIAELQKLPRRSQTSIAAQFGIKQAQVSRIMRRENWTHLWDDGDD